MGCYKVLPIPFAWHYLDRSSIIKSNKKKFTIDLGIAIQIVVAYCSGLIAMNDEQ